MSYRLKLTLTISLLVALSFGIGGTVMITTSASSSTNLREFNLNIFPLDSLTSY